MLIEVTAALVILTLLLRFAFPTVAAGTTPPRLLALVSASASLLRDTRTSASATGETMAARYDAARRRLWSRDGAIAIPSDVAFSIETGGRCPAGDGRAAILFRSDGSNCGAVLRFSRGLRTLRVRVNWADGHVDMVDGG